jgi:TolA-binding protein
VEIPEPGIVYSRVVRATVGQLVEIPFRGTGWVYLGELASRPGIVYGSRRLDPEGQSFIFRTEAPGTYGLKFYKQDFVRDYILNDHVQVIVGEPPEAALMGWFDPAVNRGRVIAEPRWPSALEEAEALGGNSPARIAAAPGLPGAQGAAQAGTTAQGTATAQETAAREAATAQDAVQTGTTAAQGVALGTATQGAAQAGTTAQGAATQGTATAQETAAQETAGGGALPAGPAAQTPGQDGESGDPRIGDYPERARREFEAGRAASAISILDQFRERYPSGSDEAWWLYGQFYEADSPSRDIRSALDYYRRLVREYPQSPRCNDARRRIAYLERYYINIR